MSTLTLRKLLLSYHQSNPPPHSALLEYLSQAKHYKYNRWTHILYSNLFYVAIVDKDTRPLETLEFIRDYIRVLQDYFGTTDLSGSLLKAHFITLYQLAEEMISRPHFLQLPVLKALVPPPSLLTSVMDAVSIGTSLGTKGPEALAPSLIPWRPAGIQYTKNEIYFDLNEQVRAVVDNKSHSIVHGQILGEMQCLSKLSGMPELLVNFVNPRMLQEGMVSFHQCVRCVSFFC